MMTAREAGALRSFVPSAIWDKRAETPRRRVTVCSRRLRCRNDRYVYIFRSNDRLLVVGPGLFEPRHIVGKVRPSVHAAAYYAQARGTNDNTRIADIAQVQSHIRVNLPVAGISIKICTPKITVLEGIFVGKPATQECARKVASSESTGRKYTASKQNIAEIAEIYLDYAQQNSFDPDLSRPLRRLFCFYANGQAHLTNGAEGEYHVSLGASESKLNIRIEGILLSAESHFTAIEGIVLRTGSRGHKARQSVDRRIVILLRCLARYVTENVNATHAACYIAGCQKLHTTLKSAGDLRDLSLPQGFIASSVIEHQTNNARPNRERGQNARVAYPKFGGLEGVWPLNPYKHAPEHHSRQQAYTQPYPWPPNNIYPSSPAFTTHSAPPNPQRTVGLGRALPVNGSAA